MKKIGSLERNTCSLCSESQNLNTIYSGSIRSGGIGSEFVDGYRVINCGNCDFVFLNREPDDIEEFYETNKYRENFDYKIDIQSMQEKFDPEQNVRISRIGMQNIRNKMIADFGAGPGIFIDAVKSIALKTIVVEPSQKYREYLVERGHECFSYAEQLLGVHADNIDAAVSFDTVEHIPEPRGFVKNIYKALKPGGVFYLSMPNLDDVVRCLCPAEYEPFFFQAAHVNYFNRSSALRLLADAGFKNINVDYIHKYDVNNILQWVKNGAPGKFDSGKIFDRAFHSHFVAEMERLGVASHLFITARK